MRAHRSAAAALTVLVVAAALTPIWYHGDDSGWHSCGSLVAKAPGPFPAENCEVIGAYRDRLVLIYALLVALGVVVVVGLRRTPADTRRRTTPALGAVAAVVVAIATLAWFDNDRRAPDRPEDPFRDIEVDFDIVATDTPGFWTIVATGRRWTAPRPVIVTTCISFPDRCDLDRAVRVEPIDGHFDVTVHVSPDDGRIIAAFDRDMRHHVSQGFAHLERSPIETVAVPPTPDG